MLTPPVLVAVDSSVAVLGNPLSFSTAASSHRTLASWWSVTSHVGLGHCAVSAVDFTMHARDALAVPLFQLCADSPMSAVAWWPERESEMTGGVTSWVAKAPTARRRQSFIVILK